jgi:hypothetical protein
VALQDQTKLMISLHGPARVVHPPFSHCVSKYCVSKFVVQGPTGFARDAYAASSPQSQGDRHDWYGRRTFKGIPRPGLGCARSGPDLCARERWNSSSRCGRHIGSRTNHNGHASQCTKMASLARLMSPGTSAERRLSSGTRAGDLWRVTQDGGFNDRNDRGRAIQPATVLGSSGSGRNLRACHHRYRSNNWCRIRTGPWSRWRPRYRTRLCSRSRGRRILRWLL